MDWLKELTVAELEQELVELGPRPTNPVALAFWTEDRDAVLAELAAR